MKFIDFVYSLFTHEQAIPMGNVHIFAESESQSLMRLNLFVTHVFGSMDISDTQYRYHVDYTMRANVESS